MTESEAIKKAIRHFEYMKNDAVVVLDSGFGTHPGESDLVYRNRKMYAELAINALEKQIPKKPRKTDSYRGVLKRVYAYACPTCHNVCLEKYMNERQNTTFCWDCGQKLDWS